MNDSIKSQLANMLERNAGDLSAQEMDWDEKVTVDDLADMDRHKYVGGVLIRHSDGGGIYDPCNIIVPRGVTPSKIEDVPEDQLASLKKVFGDRMVPTKIVTYDKALMFDGMDGDSALIPKMRVFSKGLYLYAVDPNYETTEAHMIPGPVARSFFDNVTYGEREATRRDMMKSLGVAMAAMSILAQKDEPMSPDSDEFKAQVVEQYGDHVEIADDTHGTDGFVKVNVAKVTGNVAFANNSAVGLSDTIYVFVEPGSTWRVVDMDEDEAEEVANTTHGKIKPKQYIEFKNAGIIDNIGNTQGLALGEIRVMFEDAATIELAEAWMPRKPFDMLGYKTYSGAQTDVPTKEQAEEAKNNKIGKPIRVGQQLNA